VSPNLNLQLSDGFGIANVVGTAENDTITANSLNDVLQGAALPPAPRPGEAPASHRAVPTQWVYLSFDNSGSQLHFPPDKANPAKYTYTPADEQAVLQGIQNVFAPFVASGLMQFTMNLSDIPTAVQASGDYATIAFNQTPQDENGAFFTGGR